MAWVNPRIAQIVAHTPETKSAVQRVRDHYSGVVEGLFAPHDNPGGHKVNRRDEPGPDAFVDLDGPAPLALENGHWVGTAEGRRYVEGLHIFGRATAQAEAEGRR